MSCCCFLSGTHIFCACRSKTKFFWKALRISVFYGVIKKLFTFSCSSYQFVKFFLWKNLKLQVLRNCRNVFWYGRNVHKNSVYYPINPQFWKHLLYIQKRLGEESIKNSKPSTFWNSCISRNLRAAKGVFYVKNIFINLVNLLFSEFVTGLSPNSS